MSLNEIITQVQDLAYNFKQFHQKITMPIESLSTTNQEDYCLHISFQIGGWLEKNTEEQAKFTPELRNLIAQGFGVIEVNVWAKWGGNYYDDTPIDGTIVSMLIVDRRTRWDDGSYEPITFDEAKNILQGLLDNPKSEKLIS